MKIRITRTGFEKRRGSTLLVVMGMATVLMISGAAISFMTANMSHSVIHYRDRGQALSIAEAGIADMVAKLRTNYTMWIGSTNLSAFSTGSNSVSATVQTNGNILLSSTGWVGDVAQTTVMETLGTTVDPRDVAWGQGSGLLSDGIVIMETGAPTVNGGAHSNGDFNLVNGVINGDLSSAATVNQTGGTVSGTVTSTTEPVTIPGFAFDTYLSLAQSGGIYHSGDVNLSGVITPANGVLYVNGNVSFSNNTTVNGVIVANGDVTIANRLTQNQVNGYPAVLSQGTVYLHNRNVFNGTVYGMIGIDTYNNRIVNGSLISSGPINIRNRLEVNAQASAPVWDPALTNADPDVVFGAWIK